MADWILTFITSHVLAIIGSAVIPLWGWLRSERKRKAAEAKERVSEKELDDIRRRANGPFLQATSMHVSAPVPNDGVALPSRKAKTAQKENICKGRVSGATVAGDILTLYLSNKNGAGVKSSSVTLPDGWEAGPPFNPSPSDTSIKTTGMDYFFRYVFSSPEAGKAVQIRLDFETRDGLNLHQVYETRHGFCELRRIDPA